MVDTKTLEEINKIVTEGKGYLIDRGGIDSIVHSVMQTFDGIQLVPDPIDRVVKVYCHLATTQFFSDGNKRTAEISLKVNFHQLGIQFDVPDNVLGELTLNVANNVISEDEANIEIRKYIN